MGFYCDRVIAPLLHRAMQAPDIEAQRRQVVPRASGRVLEIGLGSGLNLAHYGTAVTALVGVEPSPSLLARAAQAPRRPGLEVELVERSAERLPFAEDSFDSVVTTWTLCSIPDVAAALAEARRVLRPEGRLLFVEHGRSDRSALARWQQRLTPSWRVVSGGCRLDREIEALIEGAGFAIETIERGHFVPGPKLLTYHYRGAALPI